MPCAWYQPSQSGSHIWVCQIDDDWFIIFLGVNYFRHDKITWQVANSSYFLLETTILTPCIHSLPDQLTFKTMAHRFFLPKLPQQTSVTLDGDQAHHAAQVMRFKVGDTIILFDGQGVEVSCKIDAISRKRVEVTIVERTTVDRALSTELTLAVALPKKDRQKFLIEKLVELGVTRLIPVQAERSVATASEKVIERIEKQVIEACKQCERNRLMQITEPMNFQAIKAWADLQPKPIRRWIADPYNGVWIATVNDKVKDCEIDETSANHIPHELVAIGPEGGFSDHEVAQACDAGFQMLRISPTILRVETAAIASAAIFGAGRQQMDA